MIYRLNQTSPLFHAIMYNDLTFVPETGIVEPAVYLHKLQGAVATSSEWVEDTDFTWHEPADMNGLYKLRQVATPNVSAVDTEGVCCLSITKPGAFSSTNWAHVIYRVRAGDPVDLEQSLTAFLAAFDAGTDWLPANATVGAALYAALLAVVRAEKDGDRFRLYDLAGTTIVRDFALNSSNNPTERNPI